MIEKFDRRYRIGSSRLSKWDYGWNAYYFTTICTEEKLPYFGFIHNQQFIANSLGKIALQRWLEMPYHYPFVQLCSFVVMPNHVHGIVRIKQVINKNGDNDQCDDIDQGRDLYQRRDAINRVSTQNPSSPPIRIPQVEANTSKQGGITGHHNPMLHNNLSRVIRWYKGRVAYECRKINPEFCWQERFHEHITLLAPICNRCAAKQKRMKEALFRCATHGLQTRASGDTRVTNPRERILLIGENVIVWQMTLDNYPCYP